MTQTDKQQRWNQRYQDKIQAEQSPVLVLRSNQALLSCKGKALDLACGLGGNAICLAKLGYQVTAVDYSEVALSKLSAYAEINNLSIETVLLDFENDEFDFHGFDVIVVSYYLQRDLFSKIFSALSLNGLLFYQTFSGVSIDDAGPQNPAFRLKRGELLSLCSRHTILYYREDPDSCQGEECLCGESMIIVRKD